MTTKRKASGQVTLVMSGALSLAALPGCGPSNQNALEYETIQGAETVTNNTHRASHGYYHSHAHTWFPYAWGYHDPARGYFYDGTWSRTPRTAPPATLASTPQRVARVTTTSTSSHSVSRGGFGSSGHSTVS
jgi:hypothetical protein